MCVCVCVCVRACVCVCVCDSEIAFYLDHLRLTSLQSSEVSGLCFRLIWLARAARGRNDVTADVILLITVSTMRGPSI